MNDACPEFEQLSAYADAELGSARSRAIDDHIPHCGTCRERLRRLRSLQQAMELHLPSAPDLLPSIMAQVRSERRKGLMGWCHWSRLPLAVAAGVALWGGVLLGHAFVHRGAAPVDPLHAQMRLFDAAPPGAVYRSLHVEAMGR